MTRNLDLTALRSFVAVADSGGVTRAASALNLTQSAVSMQLKRLEASIGVALLDRSGRGIALTASGEQLLSYARRMLALNDEVYGRLTHNEFEGEIVLGVPHDIVYPWIPKVLQRFNMEFPRVQVHLLSSNTTLLKEQFSRAECDLILTTENEDDARAETLASLPLVWVGAEGGSIWKRRPLRLAFGRRCLFRKTALEALDSAGISWELVIESDQDRPIEASVSADLAIHAILEGTTAPQCEVIAHGGQLPALPEFNINMYQAPARRDQVGDVLAQFLRDAFRGGAFQAVA